MFKACGTNGLGTFWTNSTRSRGRLSSVFGSQSLPVAGFVAYMALGQSGFFVLAAVLPAYLIGKWLDSYRRSAVLFYEMDDTASAAYEAMTGAFDGVNGCKRKWHMAAGGEVRDLTTWKRNAGTHSSLKRSLQPLPTACPPSSRATLPRYCSMSGSRSSTFCRMWRWSRTAGASARSGIRNCARVGRIHDLSRTAAYQEMHKSLVTPGSIRTNLVDLIDASRTTARYLSACTKRSIFRVRAV